MENSIIAIIIISIGLVAGLASAYGQNDKVPITLWCYSYWCHNGDTSTYLVKVNDPTDNYKLIGEKKFTGQQLHNSTTLEGEATVYLDKKWVGKQVEFETIDLSSGQYSLEYVYVTEEGQIVHLPEPS